MSVASIINNTCITCIIIKELFSMPIQYIVIIINGHYSIDSSH